MSTSQACSSLLPPHGTLCAAVAELDSERESEREAVRESASRLCNKKEEGSAEGRQADEYWDRIQRLRRRLLRSYRASTRTQMAQQRVDAAASNKNREKGVHW